MSKGNDSAFPCAINGYDVEFGLTKREYIAAQIMAGLLQTTMDPAAIAQRAVKAADALLSELSLRTQPDSET